MEKKPLIAFTIPTGIGADIGGYAGDAGYIVREYSKYFKLIVNPNVVNAGIFSSINDDMYYVEGYAIDEFFKGNIKLAPLKKHEQNKIGVIFDSSIPSNILNLHLNTIEALKIVKGYDIAHIEITKEPVGVKFEINKLKFSTGFVKNEKTLLEAGQKLLLKGCNALAVVCYFGADTDDADYENANGVDPIGGVEAVISHYLTKELMVPSAHSPAFDSVDIAYQKVNPKVSSELISSTYLPCVIEGLNKAPRLLNGKIKSNTSQNIYFKDVAYLITTKDALGSAAFLECVHKEIEVCVVNNPCMLSVGCKELKINDIIGNIAQFSSYEDCLQYIRNKFYG